MTVHRRTFLAGLTALGTAPVMAQTIPTNPDVVIIGAGAAGLAAGRQLASQGVSYIILEAAGRVGGRAYTESASFGAPVDHGCSWISGSMHNPFTQIGKSQGFALVDHTNADSQLFDLKGNEASDLEWQQYDRAWSSISRALNRAGKSGKDVSATSVIPNLPYSATVQSWMGAMDYGVDFEDVSTADYWDSADDQPSYIVREGLGAIVATLAEGQPIVLNTPVSAVDWSGDGVSVVTENGTIRAKACLVTVSVGVLAANKIRFTPALPVAKQEAIDDIPMGLLMKVPLLFDGTRLGLGENNWVTYRIPESIPGEACYFVAWPTGHDYLFGNIGGKFGWELSSKGDATVIDYALGELVRLVGSDARKHFVKGLRTDWAENPLTLGAYGAPRPGRLGARKVLEEPLGNRVFFAGEAMGGSVSALVNGAYKSGKKTAKAISKALA
ncbi:MAG: flavin monoamine oxidase family protein [Arenibacterium sp.]